MPLPGTTDEYRKGVPNAAREIGRFTRANVYSGAAWYAPQVEIPAHWQGKRITLVLERTKTTRVWVDETYVGSQNTLVAAQVFDLSAVLTPGTGRVSKVMLV